MRFELDPSQDLGLQHMLQNGLFILRGVDLGSDKRGSVIAGLLEMISEADRGSEALEAQSLTFALEDKSAFERYSLIYRYLSATADRLPERLSEAKNALEGLASGEGISAEQKAVLEMLLSELLSALERDRAVSPLHMPREFNYH